MVRDQKTKDRPVWSKLLWFIGLWGGGVAVVFSLALIIRTMLGL